MSSLKPWTLGDLVWLKELYLSGQTEEEIGFEMKSSLSDIRGAIAVLGLKPRHHPSALWCDYCGHWRVKFDEKSGWCIHCVRKLDLERQLIEMDDEERRLEEELVRRANQLKKQRERMRAEYGANPRKGSGKAAGTDPAALPKEVEEPGEGFYLHDAEGVTPTP